MLIRLNDGQQAWIRPITPEDKWRLQEAHKLLSLKTIQRRYLGAKPRLTTSDLRYLTEVDGVNHIALVAISVGTGRLLGVSRAVRLAGDPHTAEWAIVVGDAVQGKGLGTLLIRALVDEARRQDIQRFSASIAGENVAVGRLLRHVGDHFQHDKLLHGIREVTVDLAAA